ncbi:MAG: hypothetical protein ACQERX_02125 [Bacillota bacterium]
MDSIGFRNNRIIYFVWELISKLLRILFIVGTIYFLRWLGLKGMIGIFVGLTGMCYFLLSDNPKIKALLRMMGVTNDKNTTEKEIREEIQEHKRKRVKFNG